MRFECGLDVVRTWLGRVFGSGAYGLQKLRESGFQHPEHFSGFGGSAPLLK